jgi:hypothetical protein
VLRQHYVEVKQPSPNSAEGAGFYPDALVPPPDPRPAPDPKAKPVPPPRFPGFPFEIAAGANQPLWVEVRVPRDAAPGDYAGRLRILADGADPVEVPLKLSVWNFELPDRPSLRTDFGGLGRRLQVGHRLPYGTEPFKTLERRYAAMMAEHRLNPPVPVQVRPLPGKDGAIPADFDPGPMRAWIREYRVTSLAVPWIDDDPAGKGRAKCATWLKSVAAMLKKEGWLDMAWVPLLEGPGDAASYEEVRKRAALVREAAPGLKTWCPEQPTPTEAKWGTLVGSVDVWVPYWRDFEAGSAAERRKAGDQVWTTTSYSPADSKAPFPAWLLDFPLLNYRVAPWTTKALGLDGLHYWTILFWAEAGDPWINPRSYQGYNGEGMLIYPGVAAGVDGPVTSLRLKALRDGLEDYEYLVLAGERGAAALAKVARTWSDWTADPAVLAAAREELAGIILGGK